MAAGTRPLVLGHRGASRAAPENTIAAFREALAQGAHGVELDVRRTVDGALVCLHDEALGRTVPGTGLVEETPAATIRAADAGAWFDARFAGERVPTLDEAADACASAVEVMVEAKASVEDRDLLLPGVSEGVAEFVRGRAVGPPLLVASKTVHILREVRAALPDQRLAAVVGRPIDGGAWRWLLGLPVQVVALRGDLATAERVADVHAAGRAVYVWTVNDVDAARRFRDLDVAAIVADAPGPIVQAFADGA